MSYSQNLVNQQLAWCSTLVEHFKAESAPWLKEALLQSLTWHLQVAYSAFLQELAESQRLACERSSSIVTVINAIPSGRGCPAEFEELKALEMNDSWLSSLLARATSPAAIAIDSGVNQPHNLIAVSGVGSWNLAEAQAVLLALRQLIERNRALGQEY
ncbi:hypothetical protein QWY82_12225 [Simiduia curdlanivorans]|uniref:DUF6586 family protein n=1 Tax=Simiduia curdlanivorans TaxID=1492769 RepID=A0ABV8V879_9GAMM|nr:DUF6586 family protein [Simiduia curdlanivorans]MDN3639564.1 hypothetical protein [Simiduia curdlanivorans]